MNTNDDFTIENVPGIGLVLVKYRGNSYEAVVPDGVVKIGYEAFRGSDVGYVKIPDSVKKIEFGAFRDCRCLVGVDLPYGIKIIEDHLFNGCRELREIDIPDSVYWIGYQAFRECTSLNSVYLSKLLKSIGCSSFMTCNSLEEITIPGSVRLIDGHAFAHCSSLRTVNCNDGLQAIGHEAFLGCDNLRNINIPDSVTSISWRTFMSCTMIETLSISSKVKNLPDVLIGRNSPTCLKIHTNNLDVIPDNLKLNAVLGFVSDEGDFNSENGQKVVKYILANADYVLQRVISDEKSLDLVLKIKGIDRGVIARYIEIAQNKNQIETAARLMRYQIDNFFDNDVDRDLAERLGIYPVWLDTWPQSSDDKKGE